MSNEEKCGYVWQLGHPDYGTHTCIREKGHGGRHRCDCGKMKAPPVKS